MNIHFTFKPPADVDAEQALLGAILINNGLLDAALAAGLKSSHFSEPLHAMIWDAITDMIDGGKKANPVTVKHLLPAGQMVAGIPISQYLARLTVEAISIQPVSDLAEIIIQASRSRNLMDLGKKAVDAGAQNLQGADFEEQVDAIADGFDLIRSSVQETKGLQTAGASYLKTFDAAAKSEHVAGVPIGIPELARVLGEPTFERGNLYGLLSSSGEGKTSLVLQLIMSAVRAGHPALVLSYDQSPVQLVRQWIAQQHGIEVRRQRQPAQLLNTDEQTKCVQFAQWIDKQPLEIIRCHREGIKPLLSYIRGFHRRHKDNPAERLIVLDHIGKVKPRDPRLDAGSISGEVTVELKAVGDEAHSAIIVLNQRNTDGTKRDNPRPIARDLYGGQGARADYDAIAYLYRSELYRKERVATAASDQDWKKINKVFGAEADIENMAELGALKCRFSNPDITEKLRFEGKYTRYVTPPPTVENYAEVRML